MKKATSANIISFLDPYVTEKNCYYYIAAEHTSVAMKAVMDEFAGVYCSVFEDKYGTTRFVVSSAKTRKVFLEAIVNTIFGIL